MKIYSFGSWAKLFESSKQHFCLGIEVDNKKILIDPAVKRGLLGDFVPDYILVSSTDKDQYFYLHEFPDIPIYSTSAVLQGLALPDGFEKKMLRPFRSDTKLNAFGLKPIKLTHRVEMPSCGFRIVKGDTKISILPEFLRIGEAEKDFITDSIWVAGCGEYEDDDEKAGKLSFIHLIVLADTLKAQALYLTNKRISLMRHKSRIERTLARYNGRILEDGDIIAL